MVTYGPGVGQIDPVAEATGGKLNWNSPGMDDFEAGHEAFPLGTRVEIRGLDHGWHKGTVVETMRENDRAIVVECDEQVHDNMSNYQGHGLTLMVYMTRRRHIVGSIRLIDEPRREVIIPRQAPCTLNGNAAKLLEIIEAAVQSSNGRIRLAYNEEDENETFNPGAARFMKLDGKRVGRDIEVYRFLGDNVAGWEQALAMSLEELLLPLKSEVPASYAAAATLLQELGKSVYTADMLNEWNKLFA